MTYQWVDTGTSQGDMIVVAFTDGVVTFDATIQAIIGTPAQTASAMGAFRDALEVAGFTVQAIQTSKDTGVELQDI